SITGPVNTPYEGGVFHLVFRAPNDHPFKPLSCRMLTKIYHPNFNAKGEVCLDILDTRWTPVITLDMMLLSMISVLDDPGLDDPLVPEIAQTYVKDRKTYEENARAYTKKYAS
ncbi:UBC-like protein, partial [Aaosphaeria arxii CBS 175.79]